MGEAKLRLEARAVHDALAPAEPDPGPRLQGLVLRQILQQAVLAGPDGKRPQALIGWRLDVAIRLDRDTGKALQLPLGVGMPTAALADQLEQLVAALRAIEAPPTVLAS